MASSLSVGWERWRALPKDRWMQVYAQVVTGNCVANGSRAHDARVRARPEARREPETAHMARIKPLDEKTIPEGSRETWAAMHKKFGKVPNLFATFAHSPAAFSGYIAFLSALDRGKLSGREIELINLHVSELNGCAYCVSAHTFLADRIGLSPDEALAARAGSAANRRDQAILA